MNIDRDILNQILRAEDIEGFIASGAPQDEYASEADAIHEMVSDLPSDHFSHENIMAILADVWRNNFNLSDSDIELRLPAMRHIVVQILENAT